MHADPSRAYFDAQAVRPVNNGGKLLMSMYGTRDAALNWAMEYGETLRAAGCVEGKTNPFLFRNKSLGVSVGVHGDDFVAAGPNKHRAATRKALEDK